MKIRFAAFTLDGDTRQVFRDGQPLRLSRKAFDLLSILLAHRPAVVDKDLLRDQLWGATTVVDANLNNLVSEIRTVLQDDPQQPKFVRTVHRVGYAFCGEASDERGPAEHDHRGWIIWNDRAIPLSAPVMVIGREPGCAIWIDVPGVSRRHASVCLAAGEAGTSVTIEDLASTNGTFVDGRPVTRSATLEDGASIRIGEATLTFRSGSSANAATKRIGKPARRKVRQP